MPDLIVSNFGRGKDRRRMQIAAPGGSLWEAVNCHINEGGEIEARKGFIEALDADLPSGTGYTFGLAEKDGGLYVFGSPAAPSGLPTGVTYQRLQHPGVANMTALLDWDLFDNKIYAAAQYSDAAVYHFYDGTRVTDWFDGKARGSFDVTGGTASAGVNMVSSVKVNGVEIMDTDIDWGTDNATTAAAIASQINSYNSTPEYTATSSGATVFIIAGTAGTTPNGYVVTVTVAGDVTVGNVAHMAGGAANAPGEPGGVVLTHEDKLYTLGGKTNVHFSGLGNAVSFNPATVGAGFFKPATHASGSAELTGLGSFLRALVIFAKKAIQIWDVHADDEENQRLQTLSRVGTTAAKSILAHDDRLFFLASLGIRAVIARDSSNSGAIDDVGAPINAPLREFLATLTQAQRDAAIAAVEPRENRLWLAVGTRVYVFSRYPDAGVRAWSEYHLAFTISDIVVVGDSLYCRSGNKVYLYGGEDFDEFDECDVEVRIPFLDADRPASYKDLETIDIALQGGPWTIKMSIDPNDPDTVDTVAITDESTFNGNGTIPAAGRTTHIAVELTCTTPDGTGTTPKVSQFVLSYARDDID